MHTLAVKNWPLYVLQRAPQESERIINGMEKLNVVVRNGNAISLTSGTKVDLKSFEPANRQLKFWETP
jgi:hypothetical protein